MTDSKRRLSELDSLRGFAAIVVVLYHYTLHFTQLLPERAAAWQRYPILSWFWPFHAGAGGVVLFFVISGFVILMSLERTTRAADFALARFIRLFPTYWAAVCITTLAINFNNPGSITLGRFISNLTMLEYWVGSPYIDGVYWSLTVELQFYVLLLALYLARKLHQVEYFCAGWIVLAGITSLALKLHLPNSIQALLRLTNDLFVLPHSTLFAAGMMFYRIYKDRVSRLRVGVIVLALGATWAGTNSLKASLVTLSFGVFAIIVRRPIRLLGTNKALQYLGAISYPLYLIHMAIGFQLMDYLVSIGSIGFVVFAVPLAVALLLGSALHFWAEVPTQRALKALLAARRTQAEAGA